jgi:predicted type IV restriction endonuclease
MDFVQRVSELSLRSIHASQHALTEEATKTAVVMPFIQALGFDVFNLEEVVPEFVADVGIKKGEKIDFALKIGGKTSVLIEVKPISTPLGSAQFSQLYRYFAVEHARLAILVNGREIWFFSDIDERNKMDKKPFFIFDLQNYDEHQVAELARFQKHNFNIDAILEAASNLKYIRATAQFLARQLSLPDDDFIRFVGREIYEGTLTKAAVEQLKPAVRAGLDEVVRKRIQERLNVTFGQESAAGRDDSSDPDSTGQASEVATTQDELDAFYIVRAICSKIVQPKRVTIRDAKSYCSVFLDDNNRKPICRFHFNGKNTRYLGVFDDEKNETKYAIAELPDIYEHSEAILKAAKLHSA